MPAQTPSPACPTGVATSPACPAPACPAVTQAGDKAPLRGQGADGTLLAVVPIPGTGTSLAIVGYPVAMPGGEIATGPATAMTAAAVRAVALPALSALAAGAPRRRTRRRGCYSTEISDGSGRTAARSR